jgi:acyl carrier protein
MTLHVNELDHLKVRDSVKSALTDYVINEVNDVEYVVFDSLDALGIAMSLEESFNIEISDDDVYRVLGYGSENVTIPGVSLDEVSLDSIARYVASRI